jgi:hypothetical protein
MILDGSQKAGEAQVFATVKEMELNIEMESLKKENESLRLLSRNLFRSITRLIDACGDYEWTRSAIKKAYSDNVDHYNKHF